MIRFNINKKESRLLNNNKSSCFKISYISLYTLIFVVMALFIFRDFIFEDITLIRKGDAFGQHYKALIYFSKYVRDFLYNILINHRFVIHQFDFNVGLGSDIISTFAYYSFGDPFNFLSFLFTAENIHHYFQFMIVFRLYCAGLSFSYLCFRMGNENFLSVLTGAVTYCFSAYALLGGLRHPYFLNPLIFLPIIVIGVENIIEGKSVILMTAIVAVSEISNFYFFYILVLLTVIYVAVRLITLYGKKIKKIIRPLLRISYSSLLGVGIGAVLFLPVILAFISDARVNNGHTLALFYTPVDYRELPVSFITRSGTITWLFPCVSVLFIPSVVILFFEKKKKLLLKALIVLSLIFMCFPVFGKIFNGFSYASNRWCFGYILVVSYIITAYWNKLIKADKKQILVISLVVIIYFAVCVVFNSEKNNEAIIQFLILAAIIAVVFTNSVKTNLKKTNSILIQVLFVCFAVASIFTYSYYMMDTEHGDFISEFTTEKKFNDISYECNEKIKEVIEKENETSRDFWRYTARSLPDNASFIDAIKSTQYYWSLSNGNVSQFRSDMNASENLTYCYEGFDARTTLNTLASVKYFINNDKSNKSLPFGFTETKVNDVYKNKYTLPFGYTYESYVTSEQFSKLNNSVKKQEVLLGSAVLEKDTKTIDKGTLNTSCDNLDYNVKIIDDDVSYSDGKFTVTSIDAQIEFDIDAIEKSEIYLSFIGMSYIRTDLYDLYSDDASVDPLNLYDMEDFDKLSDEEKELIISDPLKYKQRGKATLKMTAESKNGGSYANSFYFYNPQANFYCGRKNFDINMGYTEKGIDKIIITFPYPGIYSFDEFAIIAQRMNNYSSCINNLKTDILEDVKFSSNTVKGRINLEKNKLLCMSVPFSKGWTARVDGKKAELIKTNGMYCGLLLEKGKHIIELKYSTPGFKTGAIISVLSIAIFIVLIYYNVQLKNSGSVVHGKKRMK